VDCREAAARAVSTSACVARDRSISSHEGVRPSSATGGVNGSITERIRTTLAGGHGLCRISSKAASEWGEPSRASRIFMRWSTPNDESHSRGQAVSRAEHVPCPPFVLLVDLHELREHVHRPGIAEREAPGRRRRNQAEP